MVEAFGTGDAVIEIGEQRAWLGAALRFCRASSESLTVGHSSTISASKILFLKGPQYYLRPRSFAGSISPSRKT